MVEKIPDSENVIIKDKFAERYKALLGSSYDEFIEYSTAYIRKSIRVNTLKMSVQELLLHLKERWKLEQVPWCKEGFWIDHRGEGDDKRYDVGNLLEHILGQVYVQDAASMIPPVVLDPVLGDVVLDMCASPGFGA